MKIFAAENSDLEVRMKSSAGGVFSLLAEKVIEKGGIVYGAAFNHDWKVVHKRISSKDEIDSLRRSKYVYSHLGNTLIEAKKDLEEGKLVLFCSVPCQVAAMRKLAGDHTNLICVEVVCHGAPKPEYWERYLDELCKKIGYDKAEITSINFRDKSTGWKNYSFTIRFQNEKEFTETHEKNLYMRAFLRDYTLREACFDCKFKYPEGTQADITLGDLWGIDQLAPEINNDLGTTLVISRTKIGDGFISQFKALKEFSLEGVSQYNPAIMHSAQKPVKYIQFIKLSATKSLITLSRKFTSPSFSKRKVMVMLQTKRFLKKILK